MNLTHEGSYVLWYCMIPIQKILYDIAYYTSTSTLYEYPYTQAYGSYERKINRDRKNSKDFKYGSRREKIATNKFARTLSIKPKEGIHTVHLTKKKEEHANICIRFNFKKDFIK